MADNEAVADIVDANLLPRPPGSNFTSEERLRIMAGIGANVTDSRNTNLEDFLVRTGSLIAGGALLSFFHDDGVRDIDIYVQIKDFSELRAIIQNMGYRMRIYQDSSVYCRTHMKKNGIRRIYTFTNELDNDKAPIDIMVIRNSHKVIDVVQNFDFSFCQIWFDGNHLFATHPDDVRSKKGIILGEYNKEFIDEYRFIRRRIRKYRRKGYTIEFDTKELEKYLPEKDIENRVCEPSKKEQEKYLNNWFGHIMLKMKMKNVYYPINTPFRRQDPVTRVNPNNQSLVIPDAEYDSEDYTTLDKFNTLIPDNDELYKQYNKLKEEYISTQENFNYLLSSIFYKRDPHLYCGYLYHYKTIIMKSKKKGRCAISRLEDQDVFYMHSHVTPNNNSYNSEYNFVSQAGLERYLEANRDSLSRDNTDIPCFFSGCEKPICAYDAIFITGDEWFINFYRAFYGYGV